MDKLSNFHRSLIITSHEALLMDYELGLVRQENGSVYDSSAHLLWLGDRTRRLNQAHVAFAKGIVNPVGVKLGPSVTVEEVLELCEVLNPNRIPGRLTLISRMGVERIDELLPSIVRAVNAAGHAVIWSCDPMHGNTYKTDDGVKTRSFNAITGELKGFFQICMSEGAWPGGVHLEVSGKDVTECIGGNARGVPTEVAHLGQNYTTNCDPRLNRAQTLELAFVIAEELKKARA